MSENKANMGIERARYTMHRENSHAINDRSNEQLLDRPHDQATEPRWGAKTKAVRRALKWIRTKGAVTRDELVEWDRSHGRKLFTWDDADAAHLGRLWEAGIFLNRFRTKFEGMRVRAFIHIDEDEDAGIDQGAYYSVESISKNVAMRDQVITDITRRMANLASELKMWKLTDSERQALLDRVEKAIDHPS